MKVEYMNGYWQKTKLLQDNFQDTLKLIEEHEKLKTATNEMISRTKVYEDELFVRPLMTTSSMDHVEVVEDTTFHCARKYVACGKVAVLNFANEIHPGGGVLMGAVAQEECLCRSSNLYKGLTGAVMLNQYYKKNKKEHKKYGSGRVGYHPAVTVFKNDSVLAQTLEEQDWFQVDVITCAAPVNCDNRISYDVLYRLHLQRGRIILQAAIKNQVKILVLGAFGCGAFCNDPMVVARAYRHLLKEEGYAKYFQRVVFAIKKDYNNTRGNYTCFREVLME